MKKLDELQNFKQALNAENELESKLENLYLDEENNIRIIVFKFYPYETNITDYVK